MIDAVHAQAEQLQLSSVHWNFLVERDAQRLERRGLLPRLGCQYHWQRRDERTFDDLLARYPKAQVRNFDGRPEITELDALIAYLQMLGTLVDFSTYDAEANAR